MAQPVRLPGVSDTALAAYFVTSVTRNRVKAFDISDFGPFVAAALIEIAARLGFEVSAYVVMPDHVHFLVADPADYPLSGSTEYTIEQVCEAVQMKGWWRSD